MGAFYGTTTLGGPPITAAGGAGTTDLWVARYRPDGSHVWSIGLGSLGTDFATAVAVDSAGDVYVVGEYGTGMNFGGGVRSGTGAFVLKLSGDTGRYAWDRTFGPSSLDIGIHAIVSIPGVIVISGDFDTTTNLGGGNHTPTGGSDYFLAAYDSSSGAHLWSKPLSSTGSDSGPFRVCQVIAVDGDLIAAAGFEGTVALGGSSLVSLGDSDIFVARFHADGTHVWSMRHGGATSDAPLSLAFDGTRVLVGGIFTQTTNLGGGDIIARGGGDAFIAAYSHVDGTYEWSQRFGGIGNDAVNSIATSPSTSTLTIALTFVEPIVVGDQTFTATVSDLENPDVVIARLQPASGAPSRAWHFGSSVLDVNSMSLALVGSHLAGNGRFTQMTELFGTRLTAAGAEDIAAFQLDLESLE